MKRFLCILFFCLAACGAWANVYFRHLGKAEGLSQISVLSICQDEAGRMWFGTLEGLNCYDGNRITVYKPSNVPYVEAFGNQTHDLISDKAGSLFFISDGALLRYDLYTERFEDTRLRNVTALCNKDGLIYAACRDTLLGWDKAGKKFRIKGRTHSGARITCLYADGFKGLWAGTTSGLYYIEDPETMHQQQCIIPRMNIHSLYCDSQRRLWVAAYRKGMCLVEKRADGKLSVNSDFALSSNDVRCFVEDGDGNIWAGTFNGLNKIAPDGSVTCYCPTNLLGSLSHSSIFSLYKDLYGGIWVGTYYGGVNYFHPEADVYAYYPAGNGTLSFPYVGNMCEDKRGDLWICTEGGGLNCWRRKTDTVTHHLTEPGGTIFPNLKCIAYDGKRDRLYIGTHKQGFLHYDIATGRIRHYGTRYGTSFAEMTLRGDTLYLLSEKGLFMKPCGNEEEPRKIIVEGGGSSFDVTFFIDSAGRIWVSRAKEVVRIDADGKHSRVYPLGTNGLSRFMVSKMAESPYGEIFLGTSGSGLYRWSEAEDRFVHCLLPDADYIYQMAFHPSGYLLQLADGGLLCYHPESGDTKIIDANAQLHLAALNDGCGLLICRDGEVLVGGSNGMSTFPFTSLFKELPAHRLYFSSLTINGRPVSATASGGILQTALPFVSSVSLAHDENNITVSLASDGYGANPSQKIYEYCLDGFDKEWHTVKTHELVYTNLDPGNYTLRVRERQTGPQGGRYEIALRIGINAPWWATWWAYTLYALLVLAVGALLARNRMARMRLRASLLQEKLEKEKNEELIQAKLQFFANISHEFRTPLTLIMTQLETLLQTSGVSPHMRAKLRQIYKNTSHFRELISELLDFRKLERGKLTLRVSQGNLVSYLRQVCEDFQAQAQLQRIRLEFQTEADTLSCWFDHRQLRKVFTNLLSNALKYTPAGGKVEMLVACKGERVEIKVADSGEGIPPESIPYIFDRFYQADVKASSPSSGIGLALAKGIVELHHGAIGVQSALGYGSIFTVSLPKENPFLQDENVTLESNVTPQLPDTSVADVWAEEGEGETLEERNATDDAGKETQLLVADKEALLQEMVDLLSPLYRVVIAMDGKQGYEKAMDERPDLIVSDVMMPVMSGTEMCKKIKNNFDLCHIPVILLTALTSDQDKLEGLQCGADDYIEKPFSTQLLTGTIANLLRTRRLLRKKFAGEIATVKEVPEENVAPLALNPIDADFLARIRALVDEHISDSEWNITALTNELKVSRTSLYSKLRALGSITPNEYILRIRLERAADMLKKYPDMQISEVSDRCGFSSQRYFRQCFKARYNRTPQEFRQE